MDYREVQVCIEPYLDLNSVLYRKNYKYYYYKYTMVEKYRWYTYKLANAELSAQTVENLHRDKVGLEKLLDSRQKALAQYMEDGIIAKLPPALAAKATRYVEGIANVKEQLVLLEEQLSLHEASLGEIDRKTNLFLMNLKPEAKERYYENLPHELNILGVWRKELIRLNKALDVLKLPHSRVVVDLVAMEELQATKYAAITLLKPYCELQSLLKTYFGHETRNQQVRLSEVKPRIDLLIADLQPYPIKVAPDWLEELKANLWAMGGQVYSRVG